MRDTAPYFTDGWIMLCIRKKSENYRSDADRLTYLVRRTCNIFFKILIMLLKRQSRGKEILKFEGGGKMKKRND